MKEGEEELSTINERQKKGRVEDLTTRAPIPPGKREKNVEEKEKASSKLLTMKLGTPMNRLIEGKRKK